MIRQGDAAARQVISMGAGFDPVAGFGGIQRGFQIIAERGRQGLLIAGAGADGVESRRCRVLQGRRQQALQRLDFTFQGVALCRDVPPRLDCGLQCRIGFRALRFGEGQRIAGFGKRGLCGIGFGLGTVQGGEGF